MKECKLKIKVGNAVIRWIHLSIYLHGVKFRKKLGQYRNKEYFKTPLYNEIWNRNITERTEYSNPLSSF
jgi:hypothetical protein